MLGLQQSSTWGWSAVATWVCIAGGLLLMAAFVMWELRVEEPLLRLQIFADRAFSVDNIVLGFMSVAFVPFFFFASVYAQTSLGESASEAGLYLLYFFIGFVVMAQIGGRVLDRRGARPAVVMGSALAAVGFYLLAGKLTDLSLHAQTLYIILAGGGVGLMLGPTSTDAVNRAPSSSYSEVTGITQTSRNFGATLGLAVLGALLIQQDKANVSNTLTAHGVSHGLATRIAASLGSEQSGANAVHRGPFLHQIQLATAHSSQTVFYAMAGVMAAAFVISVIWLPRGRVEPATDQDSFAAMSRPVRPAARRPRLPAGDCGRREARGRGSRRRGPPAARGRPGRRCARRPGVLLEHRGTVCARCRGARVGNGLSRWNGRQRRAADDRQRPSCDNESGCSGCSTATCCRSPR